MIGGGGSIQGMITTLSNNKKLLRSKKAFHKERTFLNLKEENLEGLQGKIETQKVSEEELSEIRNKTIRGRRRENVLLIGMVIIITSVVFYFTVGFIQQSDKDTKELHALILEKKAKKKERAFLVLIEKGDDWFAQGKWHNSIFFYKKAHRIFKNNFAINYRLVRSYSFECEYELQQCEEAKLLLDELFLKFPDKETELLAIKDRLAYEY